jgi:beta-galactosidase
MKKINIKNTMKKILLFVIGISLVCLHAAAGPRKTILLDEGWKFLQKDVKDASSPKFNDADWETVKMAHDWAINKPFNMNIDWQVVQVKADGSGATP